MDIKRIVELKKEYNTMLARSRNAERFFADPSFSRQEKEEQKPLYHWINSECVRILNELRDMMVDYTDEDCFNGFANPELIRVDVSSEIQKAIDEKTEVAWDEIIVKTQSCKIILCGRIEREQ